MNCFESHRRRSLTHSIISKNIRTLERGTLIPALSNLKQMTELPPRISAASDSFSGLSDPNVDDRGGATSKHAAGLQGAACGWGATTVVPAEGMTRGKALEFPSLVMAAEAKVWVELEEGRTALKRALMPRPSLRGSSASRPLQRDARSLCALVPICGRGISRMTISSLINPNSTKNIVILNLASRTLEAKSLVGSYVSSTEDPGKFVFVGGPLLRAMKEGKWLVCQDIDRASDFWHRWRRDGFDCCHNGHLS
ncbi:hypothetical protein PCASD_20427 [Puccinia coronata f. sp. avenae]|uniref:Uncharacterized protein n=1 Tax=Puccinia coronata f. sp. avenae TaxID=200324 RepID=A0A2N5U1U5_9BASI|nr:hypothetical protein PCASD_20427 [Puccinia coronata f. sp. avenae]